MAPIMTTRTMQFMSRSIKTMQIKTMASQSWRVIPER